MRSTSRFTRSPGLRSPHVVGERGNEVDTEALAFASLTVRETRRARPTFGGNERSTWRGFQHEADAVAVGLAREDGGRAVDMAGHEMAAELISERERPFEIDAAPLPPEPRVVRERFVGDIDGKARAFALCLGDIDDGEATAVAGDRSPLRGSGV